MKTKIVRGIQLFWAYFIALGAVVGFGMMIYDPSGVTFQMDPLLPEASLYNAGHGRHHCEHTRYAASRRGGG